VGPKQVSSQPGADQKHRQSKKRKGHRRASPQRTCVGCRTVNPKREMMRIVRAPDGTVDLDSSGKQSGRGAYLCCNRSCWETALKRRSLDHALKVTLDESTRATLAAYAQTLPETSEITTPISDQEDH
jgi:predicted RNA-binding protein YlxR (DUF448 family)